MAQDASKQKLANLIQSYEQVVTSAQSLYSDADLKVWAVNISLDAQEKIKEVKKKLKDTFSIVLVDHMDGMKGSTAIIKSYSTPAMLSDITMKDGMKMNEHKWLTNNEVKLK